MLAPKSPPTLLTLILLTGTSTLSLNMIMPSLVSIARDLDAAYSTVSLAISGYLAATAVVQLAAGPLSDRFGRRPVILVALTVFTGASLVCANAGDIRLLLVFRMLQAAMISGFAMSLAIVRDTTSPPQAAGLIGYISMSMAIAPMLGPMVGGLIDAQFGWRAIFYLYAAAGVTLLLVCLVDLGETHRPSATRTDANQNGVRGLLGIPRFWGYALCGAFSVGAFYIFLAGAPLVAATTFSASTSTTGFLIGSVTGGFITGSFIAGRIAPQVRLTTMMLAGRLISCAGLATGLVLVLLGFVSEATYFGATLFVGLGNGLTMPSCNAGALSVRPDLAGTAAGLTGALVVATGALLTFLTGQVLPDKGAAAMLLALLLTAALMGLFAAAWTWRMEAGVRSAARTQ